MTEDKFGDEKRQALNLQRFDNICELVKKIPTYLLHFSKNGLFWEDMPSRLFLIWVISFFSMFPRTFNVR